ncbi:polysaccharide biosynthesis tyrosine autokinase [Brevibacterium sp. 50QC2O2]|uniref:polysaccharide biosynthesis tyrosine autokinase n=1 Tax=Brevibacterium sp. 50QC2O2 TaxID=2968459 RepID=UPI00211BCBAB|nr:polysaccharide biosynthesis tyrosine autokinase [Brevibacterium sp. 50QC2O2]
MPLVDYLRLLRERWVTVVVMGIIGTVLAGTLAVIQNPQYQASVKVFVSTINSGEAVELQQGSTFAQQRVLSYADLATTSAVLTPVIDELQLNTTPTALAKTIASSATTNTALIEIEVTNSDAKKSAQIANAVSNSLSSVIADLESTSSSKSSPVKVTTVEPASTPERPVSPRLNLYIVVGLFLGLAFGLTSIVLRKMLDTKIRSDRDIAAVTSTPVVGGIPFDKSIDQHRLVVKLKPLSPAAEMYRAVRTNLEFLESDSTNRSFLITSSVQSEGKSTLAANLALTITDSGKRVLLIDADLRRPAVDRYFDIDGTQGLTDLLIGRVEPLTVLQQWGHTNLYLLPAGHIPPNPSELLSSEAFRAVLEEFSEVFDVVLIDSAPLLPVTDSVVLSKLTTGIILAAAINKTTKSQLANSLEVVERVGSAVSGIVLTMIPARGIGYGRYQSSYYSNNAAKS